MMRLSDAIRLGAMLKPQSYGEVNTPSRSCAIGAALEAVGKLDGPFMPDEWNYILRTPLAVCPACGHRQGSEPDFDRGVHGAHALVIAHLNDDHQWSRELIAEWVAAEETKELARLRTCLAAATAKPAVSPAASEAP